MNDAERCSDDDDADATACAMHEDNAIDGKSVKSDDDDGEDIMSMRECNDDDRDDGDDDDDADDGEESEEADGAEAISVCQSCNSVGHKTRSHFKCPKHICAKCHTEGHNKNNCPQAQCPYCGLFGHVTKKDCAQIPPLPRRGSRLPVVRLPWQISEVWPGFPSCGMAAQPGQPFQRRQSMEAASGPFKDGTLGICLQGGEPRELRDHG